MTAKQYLMEVHRLRNRIDALKLREEDLRTQAEGLRAILYGKDRVQTSVTNRFDDLMTDLVTAQAEYAATIDRLNREIKIREAQIAEMDKPEHEEILRHRYIETDSFGQQLKLETIAKMMGMDYGSIRHLHGKALMAFEEQYGDINRGIHN